MNAWERIISLINGGPKTGTYSVEDDARRYPSMVPGNSQWLAPAILAGYSPRLTEEQFKRAADYAQQTGNSKPANEPMSPLGSEFDFLNLSAPRRQDLERLQYLIGTK